MIDWNSFHLLRPAWLLMLVPALLILWFWWRRQRGGSSIASRFDPVLISALLEEAPERRATVLPALTGLGILLAILALCGPAWERLPQPVERDADGLVLIFDLSLSMFAEDIKPSRLVRARQKITDVLRLRNQGFTGLVAYAGDAHTVAPLTDDTNTIINLLESLSPDMMPVLGTDTDAAIELAQELLRNAGFQQGRLLLITDSLDDQRAVLELRSRAFPLSILGIGTADGGPIPLAFAKQPGRVLRTQQGEVVQVKLNERRLQETAELCYGRYRRATIGDADVEALLETALPDQSEVQESDRLFDLWADRGYWLALFAVPLLLLGFRRGALVQLPLTGPAVLLCASAVLTLSTPTQGMAADALATEALETTESEAEAARVLERPGPVARWWDSLWQRPDQQAYERLNEGLPELAATQFEDPDWRAVADYRSGAYADAAGQFSAGTQPRDIYNYGNALARLGNYEAAIDAYEQVLATDPADEDAQFNRELLQQLLEQQQQQSSNQDQSGEGQEDDEPEGEQGESGSGSPEQQPAEPEAGSESQQSETGDEQTADEATRDGEQQADAQDAEEGRDENSEALEQWLRRVPDDPGGLLRRKFQYETNERLRSGELTRRNTERIW
ncbi:MAG: VWA domain-containing protein [Pseudomonadota bacterium]